MLFKEKILLKIQKKCMMVKNGHESKTLTKAELILTSTLPDANCINVTLIITDYLSVVTLVQ